jgi:hypothetical protein
MKFSDDYISGLLIKYKNRGILIDANLLLLYFVGNYDLRRILSFKRTKTFTVDDFNLLVGLFKFFDKVVTTPNILTEVSNLSGELSEQEKPIYHDEFANRVAFLTEEYIESRAAVTQDHFKKFGLTDSVILEEAKGEYLVLSDDAQLIAYAQNVGIDALNFNHIRVLNWND